MEQKIKDVTRLALEGLRKVRITFAQEATPADIGHLFGMENGGKFTIDPNHRTNLFAAQASGKWGHYSNRIVVLTLTERFDEQWFLEKMTQALEKIEVVR